MTEKATIIGILVSLLSTLLTFVDKNIIKSFLKSGATSASSAIPKSYQNGIQKWRFNRLIARGEICEVDGGKFYFNEELHHISKSNRRKRALILGSLSALFILAYYFLIQ